MQALINKKILLGVTGGIAAYKSAELVRLLVKAGAEVRVVMTPSAQEFVQPLTYQALSGHRVYIDLFDAEAESAMDHIELARWCDLLLVAPASADFIGKMGAGYADNLLLTLCLASKRPVAVAPAMNQQMFANPATQDNLNQLTARGVLVWGPSAGEQACGDVGPGRMLEPEQLLDNMVLQFAPGRLQGTRLLLTAGPTREAIDPVRYISNRSSGKMGYALAEAALQAGADVTLVSGPVALIAPTGAKLVTVESAQQMYEAVMQRASQSEIFIGCAAVSDYRVEQVAENKIKKSAETMSLQLTLNVDILAAISGLENRPFCVGFAAETQDLEKYALAKLEQKNLDMIAANRVGNDESGFETDFNQLEVFWRDGHGSIERGSKSGVAKQLIDLIAERYTSARS
ncbi:MAG: bifunctional phosphopantothenoylcysteine decarboxylase/phosphopantothenate--cysteine ligase CoaBC [Gammaproteobacteria bacterium]|nr:bifunctional phosphopantothenoylcysteine decarboxylase/phosphopantothenate--cysteine ligase CoaBC [Gammaproteobacteria bacterium]MDH3856653.1 bifunctional phosphopantothenoylcysteine decarboxylase/phosphopantothenate--cysteine ligase CoaBC [Gammaproteobacteria bacterium]